ncbi:MAG: hypothetical protein D4R63_06130 [Methylococcaceae bacterium]|nr:MAG: hypothetical protein D4R63_06130 [Methylococcaceae bacterium]
MEQDSKRRIEEANREKANKERLRNEQAKTADFGEYPTNYKEIVQEYMQLSLRDPDSARYRFAAEPKKVNSFTDNSAKENDVFCYEVAVFINAKNGYGGYSGEKIYFLYIKNGQVIGELGGS